MTGEPAQEVVFKVIDMVVSDTRLSESVRRFARDLVPLAETKPGAAWERLVAKSQETAAGLPRQAATEDLQRFVGVASFHLNHLRADVRDFYPDPASYAEEIASVADPGKTLLDHLDKSEPLFPAEHSWLVPAAQMVGIGSGADAMRALETKTRPPFVVFNLSHSKLNSAGVTVRAPRAVDAAPGPYLEWRPTGVAGGQSELIDGDVPQAALEGLSWLA